MPIRGLLLDREGVLSTLAWEEAVVFLRPLVPLPLGELTSRLLAWAEHVGFPQSKDEDARFFQGFWEQLAANLSLSNAVRDRLCTFNYLSLVRPLPDVRPALQCARARGLRIGVLTNVALTSVEATLGAAGVLDVVDVVCTAATLGVAKPHPKAYLRALAALDLTPDECLFFDDELPNVEGARAIGMAAYLVDRSQERDNAAASVLHDLSSLETVLDYHR